MGMVRMGGVFTNSEVGTLEALARAHFPDYDILNQNTNEPYIENYACSKDKWVEANRIINSVRVEWEISTVAPFNAAGID